MGDHFQALRGSSRSGMARLLARTRRTPSRLGPTTNQSSGLTCECPLGLRPHATRRCSRWRSWVMLRSQLFWSHLRLLVKARDAVSTCLHSRGGGVATCTVVLCSRHKMGPLCLLHLLTSLMRVRSCSGANWVLRFSMWSCACCVHASYCCLLCSCHSGGSLAFVSRRVLGLLARARFLCPVLLYGLPLGGLGLCNCLVVVWKLLLSRIVFYIKHCPYPFWMMTSPAFNPCARHLEAAEPIRHRKQNGIYSIT